MATPLNIYAHPKAPSWGCIEHAIKTANGLQTHFRFESIDASKWLPADDEDVPFKKFIKRICRIRPEVRGVVFCEGAFKNGILVNECLPHRVYVSCYVDDDLSAPPFGLYVLYQIASAALALSSGISEAVNEEMTHDPPIGCLWDWWRDAVQRGAGMVAARICAQCKSALQTHGAVPSEGIAAIQAILDYIRRTMMGESPGIANRIFIAYGRSQDWEDLRMLLEKWGLQVEHFNREQPAGLLVAERWLQMLNGSRFAFAIMTPDDLMKDGKRLARQNVIHEIGLCHARLGLRNTAILIAKGTEEFSNAKGINYIPFTLGALGAQADKIRKLLEERGIL